MDDESWCCVGVCLGNLWVGCYLVWWLGWCGFLVRICGLIIC